ncbi:MAG: hypothetical protein M0C28_45090 [Candidatus Moduliflexus flocculans]|nr:hypothetical protein [Candidatus Moduliflexus flocculans]
MPAAAPLEPATKNTLTPGDPGSDISPFFTPGKPKPEAPAEKPRVHAAPAPPAKPAPAPKPAVQTGGSAGEKARAGQARSQSHGSRGDRRDGPVRHYGGDEEPARARRPSSWSASASPPSPSPGSSSCGPRIPPRRPGACRLSRR